MLLHHCQNAVRATVTVPILEHHVSPMLGRPENKHRWQQYRATGAEANSYVAHAAGLHSASKRKVEIDARETVSGSGCNDRRHTFLERHIYVTNTTCQQFPDIPA